MLQVKCDVCGKVLDMNDHDTIFFKARFQQVYHFRFSGENATSLSDYGIKDNTAYDMCSGCVKTLSKFLNGELGITKV